MLTCLVFKQLRKPTGGCDQVFERFFQVEPARTGVSKARGTGLGLAIIKHATEQLGGTVSLTSQPGQGTTVRVEIFP